MTSPEEIANLVEAVTFWLRRWKRYPLGYVIECIGDTPTHQQAEILKAFEHHNFVAVASGHGIGKSKLTGWLVNWWLDTRGKRAPITGAGGDQLNDIVWPEVIATCDRKWPWIRDQYEKTSGELRLKSSRELAKAVLRVTRQDNSDALQGFHDCMFFIDEGSGVRDEVFEVASGAMGDPGAFGFMDGNPTRLSGYMYRVFHQRTFWYTMRFSSADSLSDREYSYTYIDPLGEIRIIRTKGRQTAQWIRNMKTEYGENSNTYRIRVLGEFAQLGRDQVIDSLWLDRVTVDTSRREKQGIRRMGIDPAWTGDDDTAVVIREGNDILHIESWHGFDTVQSFNRAKVIFDDWNCDFVHVDTIGIGAGIYDQFMHTMRNGRLGYPALKCPASEAAPQDGGTVCAKLRDWLWWRARSFFSKKAVRFYGSPDDDGWLQLKKELIEPTYKIMPNGAVKVEGKDEMKSRGLKSPNVADALNLTFHGDSELFAEKFIYRDEGRKKKKKPPLSFKCC